MTLKYFVHSDKWLIKLLQLPTIKRFLLLMSCVICGWSVLVFQLTMQYQHTKQIERMVLQRQEELQHQQRILATLKQNTQESVLTPELTNEISLINQRIQRISEPIKLQSLQWSFQSTPQLHMQIESNFEDFQDFFRTLLRHVPRLMLFSLELRKAEDNPDVSIYCEVLLQLQQG